MTDWNFADVLEVVAAAVPEAPCQIQGERVLSYADFDRRANGLAQALLDGGLGQQSKVAAYLYNGPEFTETYVAAIKAGMVPVNTNYRYGPEEIVYLFDNADAEAVVFHASFGPLLEGVRERLPGVKLWIVVDDGDAPLPAWAIPYEGLVTGGRAEPVRGPWGRSGDDIIMLYTGGTTGMPKGVMWRQDDLFNVLGGGGNPILGVPAATDLEEFRSRILGAGFRLMPACPLMHGTGQFSNFINLIGAGATVLSANRNFDAAGMWTEVQAKGVNALVIVGDAFARPLLAALDAEPDRWDLSALFLITSSGVMWSQETKQGLVGHIPHVTLFDSLGSSEAVGLASSTSSAGGAQDTAKFVIGDRVHVFTDDGKAVEPGSDEMGFVAISGWVPLGYYKDEEKTAKTFRTIDGVRYSIPGDYATVGTDGTLHLLGRGSQCINTGGEKVYPEEVEEALKQHPSVRDAACVGLPDERFGETICALVEPEPGATIDSEALVEHVRSQLARYKAPRQVFSISTIGRSPAGKLDYKSLKTQALELAGLAGPV